VSRWLRSGPHRSVRPTAPTISEPPENNATITYISPRAEYTPPVIYSQGARAKLVFMIEARPDPTHLLQPGLPVSVKLLKAGTAQAQR